MARTPLSAGAGQRRKAERAQTGGMETATDDQVSSGPAPIRSDPALTPFVTATAAEIAYAEELLRQIELRYLKRPAEPRAPADAHPR